MITDLFQFCGHCWVFQICWHIECSTFTASSFRIWNSSTGITSPPLALFVVMLLKIHLTSHSRMSDSSWVITPSWLSGSWRSFLYSFSVYSCHLASNLKYVQVPQSQLLYFHIQYINSFFMMYMSLLGLPWWLRWKRICPQWSRPRFSPWVGEDPLQKGMITRSNILAYTILWIEESGRLQSMGSQKVEHEWVTNTFTLFLNIIFYIWRLGIYSFLLFLIIWQLTL